jgi:2-polyprenyl-3-methyl-5-hydroxy-6-metoxy-1,4-benzoquinol methylase
LQNNKLSTLYKIRFPKKVLDRKNQIWKIICANFLQKYISKHSTVVDVGCGFGEFINNINASKKIAIDLNPDAKNYLNPEVEFKLIRALNLSFIKKRGGVVVDVIFNSNFLEHLSSQQEVAHFLGRMYENIKPGGRIAIIGPNFKYAYSTFTKASLGFEYFGNTGKIFNSYKLADQAHQLFLVVDLFLHPLFEFNFGIGKGLTASSNGLTAKCFIGRRIIWKHK